MDFPIRACFLHHTVFFKASSTESMPQSSSMRIHSCPPIFSPRRPNSFRSSSFSRRWVAVSSDETNRREVSVPGEALAVTKMRMASGARFRREQAVSMPSRGGSGCPRRSGQRSATRFAARRSRRRKGSWHKRRQRGAAPKRRLHFPEKSAVVVTEQFEPCRRPHIKNAARPVLAPRAERRRPAARRFGINSD